MSVYAREDLRLKLLNYSSRFPNEKDKVEKCLSLLEQDLCLDRSFCGDGHFTTSALILHPDYKNNNLILFTHHKVFNEWYQLGGHFEDDLDVFESAKREAIEESGFEELDEITSEIVDIDVHFIEKNDSKKEGEHYHYDLRFIFLSPDENFKVSNESHDLKWFSKEDSIEKSPNCVHFWEKIGHFLS